MKELHELRFIHKKIKIREHTKKLFSDIKNTIMWYNKSAFKARHIDLWLIYMMGLLEGLSFSDTKEMSDRFIFRRSDRTRLLSYSRHSKKALKKLSLRNIIASSVYNTLEPLSFEEVLFLRARTKIKKIHYRIEEFLARHNRVRIKIGGEELKKLGVKPGPLYAEILKKVLHEKIDGKIKTKNDEINFVKRSL